MLNCGTPTFSLLGHLDWQIYLQMYITASSRKSPNLTIARRRYDCLKKYREAWKALLDDHLASGRMRSSASPYPLPLCPHSEERLFISP